MDESSFWSTRVRGWLLHGGEGYAERVESGLGAGLPDVHYVVEGRLGWIELKYRPIAPVRDYTRVFPEGKGLRKEQRAWWLHYLSRGGRGVLIAGVARKVYCWRMTAELARSFNEMSWADFQGGEITWAGELRARC